MLSLSVQLRRVLLIMVLLIMAPAIVAGIGGEAEAPALAMKDDREVDGATAGECADIIAVQGDALRYGYRDQARSSA
jgi:hypothetical protein